MLRSCHLNVISLLFSSHVITSVILSPPESTPTSPRPCHLIVVMNVINVLFMCFSLVPQKPIRAMSWTRSPRRSRCRRCGVTWPRSQGSGRCWPVDTWRWFSLAGTSSTIVGALFLLTTWQRAHFAHFTLCVPYQTPYTWWLKATLFVQRHSNTKSIQSALRRHESPSEGNQWESSTEID